MNDTLIKNTINTLNTAFQEFKTTNDERLSELESKQKSDTLYDDKINRLNNEMDSLMGKIDTLKNHSTISQRPLLDGTYDQKSSATSKALHDFVFSGNRNALRHLDTKSNRMHTGSIEDGGAFLPENITCELRNALTNLSPIRSVADTKVTSFHQYDYVVNTNKWTENEGKKMWVSKDVPVAEDIRKNGSKTPQLKKLKYDLFMLVEILRISPHLQEDCQFDIMHWLTEQSSEVFARTENWAFVHGNGQAMPEGLLGEHIQFDKNETSNKVQEFKTGRNGEFANNNPDDVLLDIAHSLRPEYMRNGQWLMPRSVLSKIRQLKSRSGDYLWHPNLHSGTADSFLLGYPIVVCDDLPAVTSEKSTRSVLFGDFKSGYTVVDHTCTSLLQDPYSSKPDIDLMIRRRVGAGYKEHNAIKCLTFGV